ncbi:hypothetical protein NJ959_10860 [Symplocastrum sp. BBK-W-15]|uniref:Uncharacterized protein n=1 Tax=Limnofasciculus baicalensis BBK-W-15 TaxID=2699891 RepID=A0AAE3KMM5_9CYAN|nr:hypothetical protein [Limnofasciculus baicalensis BBK-W-15]
MINGVMAEIWTNPFKYGEDGFNTKPKGKDRAQATEILTCKHCPINPVDSITLKDSNK